MSFSAFVLTVEKEGGTRCRNAAAQLQDCGWTWHFVEGIHYSTPRYAEETRREYSPMRNRFFHYRGLADGEIATYASHRLVWREFLESDAELALVLEDDFHVTDPERFRQAVNDIVSNPGGWDIVKLHDHNPRGILRRKALGSTDIVQYRKITTSAVGYVLTRPGPEAPVEDTHLPPCR